jgi:hypothetical protein
LYQKAAGREVGRLWDGRRFGKDVIQAERLATRCMLVVGEWLEVEM